MDNNYFEVRLQINPEMEDLISEIFFDNFDCEGVVLAEETYKDLEMVSTTEGTLKIFLRSSSGETYEDLKYDIENILDLSREEFLSRGLTDENLGSWDFELEEKQTEDWSQKWKEKWDVTHVTDKIAVVPDWIDYEPKNNEGSWDFELEEKQTEDWSQKWKEKWDVTHVTDKIAVVPDWIDYEPKNNEVTIKLEPGCAFGTGTHQTTQLCMKALEKYMKQGDRVADIGMGSGILSILAKKLGSCRYRYGVRHFVNSC